MSKRGRIPIGAARDMSRKYNCPMIVIYAIEANGERFCVTTYGATKKMCRHAGDIGRKFSEAVMDERVAPAEVEPIDVPDAPAIFESQGGNAS